MTNNNIDEHLHLENVVGAILGEESKRKSKVERVKNSKQVEALMMRGCKKDVV